jgi:hypothetical protein
MSHELIEEFHKEHKTHRMEGETGVHNLCRLVHALGYVDRRHFGQFHQNGSIGDLIEFLSDNSGCIEAIQEWIADNMGEEWQGNLEAYLPFKEEEEPQLD